MERATLKRLLSRLNRHAFEAFFLEHFRGDEDLQYLEKLPEAGEDVFYGVPLDSYGHSVHVAYRLHYLPLSVFREPKDIELNDAALFRSFKRIHEIYKGQFGYFGMVSPSLRRTRKLQALFVITNGHGMTRKEYEISLIPKYAATGSVPTG